MDGKSAERPLRQESLRMMRESRALGLRLLTKPWSPRKKDRQDRPPHNQVRESRALAARRGMLSARARERERERERDCIYIAYM